MNYYNASRRLRSRRDERVGCVDRRGRPWVGTPTFLLRADLLHPSVKWGGVQSKGAARLLRKQVDGPTVYFDTCIEDKAGEPLWLCWQDHTPVLIGCNVDDLLRALMPDHINRVHTDPMVVQYRRPHDRALLAIQATRHPRYALDWTGRG